LLARMERMGLTLRWKIMKINTLRIKNSTLYRLEDFLVMNGQILPLFILFYMLKLIAL